MNQFGDLKKINDYKIIKLLGEGGFGKVYLVEKNKIKYALKIFISEAEYPGDHEFVESNKYNYEEEYLILSKLKSKCDPNKTPIVCLIDNGNFILYDVTYYYLVMEYIEGYTLSQYIYLCQKKNIKISVECIIKIIYHILKGLVYLHENGISHSDISINNIIFNKSQLKIIDMGTSSINNSEQFIKRDIQDLSIVVAFYLYDLSSTKNEFIENNINKYSNDIYFEKEFKKIPTAKQLMEKFEKEYSFLK